MAQLITLPRAPILDRPIVNRNSDTCFGAPVDVAQEKLVVIYSRTLQDYEIIEGEINGACSWHERDKKIHI
jgi:hypothetical protein